MITQDLLRLDQVFGRSLVIGVTGRLFDQLIIGLVAPLAAIKRSIGEEHIQIGHRIVIVCDPTGKS